MDKTASNSNAETLSRLAELDGKGFLFPPGADPQAVIATAGATLKWAEKIREDLRETGEAVVMGEKFSAGQLVPDETLQTCLQPAEERYGIAPQWVPAFYSNRLLPWYVGGACFYDSEGNTGRVCFILRDNFRNRQKWLCYNRKDIISHEICHVARARMEQNIFEEPLAYRISEKRLRRGLGPMFRGTWEGVSILAGSLIILAGATSATLGAPARIQHVAAVPLLATVALLGIRTAKAQRLLKKTIENLGTLYGERAEAVAFRCTDREVAELAGNEDTRKLLQKYADSEKHGMRWGIINRLF